MITEFKIFERKIISDADIKKFSPENQKKYNNFKFQLGEPVRLHLPDPIVNHQFATNKIYFIR